MDFGQGKVVPVNLEHEMKNSYIDYAMSVIVSRALPDVRDGLKPVHRRVLYAMQEAGMGPTKPYKKSARIVGEVLGKYHPHGDTSVYDAIVRMAQDFSMRYMLADGHGNFGSVDGDPAAAMRYTEVRMSRIAELMLQDIDKETVDFVPNYDESLKEPSVLPAKFPQLLVNGTSGIAVGMATNIPPHNMGEVIDGTLMLIDHPDATVEELMQVIKGPDFPTAGLILGTEGITALNDESDRTGMRIVIDLRRDANANVILNQLYKHTKLQDSFGVIMLALVDGKPQVLNLKQVLHYYIKHQEDVITRRTQYELKKAQERAHILEGLTIALDHLDAVITTIRESRTADIAKAALMEGFSLSDRQAQAILDLRLQRLTGLEREKIEQEYQETLKAIEEYKAILADENRILGIIKDELTAVKKKFGDARRTKLTIDTSEIDVEDLIAEEDVVITMTHGGYIKRIPLDTYRRQNRGGKGIKGMPTKEKDFVEDMLITTTHHTILFFTNRGRVYHLKAYEIAESSRTAKGTAIINLLQLQPGESIRAIIQVREFNPDAYLFFATRKGIVKKTGLIEFQNLHKGGLNAINLDDDDDLIGVKFTSGSHDIILGTKWGMAIIFSEDDVRSMGRTARGVKGIRLNDGDEVIAMDSLRQNSEVLTVTAEGYGKRTEAGEYRIQTRGGKGLINLKVTEKTGDVIGLRVVHPDQELMLITEDGIVIRTTISDIRNTGRNASGVKLITTSEGDQVASMAVLDQKD